MGQKHNRRRTRPRTRHRQNKPLDQRYQLALAPTNTQLVFDPGIFTTYPSYIAPVKPADRSSVLPAQTCHNRYIAWQNRERRQREEAAKLEAEQCRLFGGEPGDDVALCYRMLEYFGGLDYIDSRFDCS